MVTNSIWCFRFVAIFSAFISCRNCHWVERRRNVTLSRTLRMLQISIVSAATACRRRNRFRCAKDGTTVRTKKKPIRNEGRKEGRMRVYLDLCHWWSCSWVCRPIVWLPCRWKLWSSPDWHSLLQSLLLQLQKKKKKLFNRRYGQRTGSTHAIV